MGVSSEFRAVVEAIPKDFADPAADYLAVRKMFGPFHGHPTGSDLHVDILDLGGVRCGVHTLEGASRERHAFHCHGGAFVSTPLDEYHFYAEIIARQVDCTVLMPDYRLAPEHPWPAAADDCFDAWRGCLDSGVDPARTVFMGESCGGSLALATLLRARAEGLPMPACFVSLTGWFDLSVAGEPAPGRDPFLTPGWVRKRARDYLAGRLEPDDPRVSPAYADLAGLPPMYLQVGEFDTVREGALRLGDNALRAGVEVALEEWRGMVQGWHGLVNAGVPEAQDAWARIRDYVDKAIPP